LNYDNIRKRLQKEKKLKEKKGRGKVLSRQKSGLLIERDRSFGKGGELGKSAVSSEGSSER